MIVPTRHCNCVQRSELLFCCEHKLIVAICDGPVVDAVHDTRALVLTHAALKEIGLPLEGDELHPIKGIGGMVQLLAAKGQQQTVGNKLDVARHHVCIHPHQRARQRIAHKLALQVHCLAHDLPHDLLVQLVVQQGVQVARKVGVETLISADELVGERQPRHQPAFLQPEYRAETARKVDPLDACKCHHTVSKAARRVDPTDGPLRLFCNAWNRLNGIEVEGLLCRVLNVRVQQKTVHLTVHVFDGDLEAVKGTRLRDHDLGHESHSQVLQHNAVRRGKEG
mmetsp:Transcript_35383/g.88767  ORF Transcript_35383/g.88767 Transcript_35383/m.88767 type:complete len:281 (-) Transcript_35383:694-1536(-)